MTAALMTLLAACTTPESDAFVALVPAGQWVDDGRVNEAGVGEPPDHDQGEPDGLPEVAIAGRADDPDAVERMVHLTLSPWPGSPLPDGRPIQVGGVEAEYASLDHTPAVVVQVQGAERSLQVRALEGTDPHELADLAASVDLDQPLADQDLAPGWVVVGVFPRDGSTGRVHTVDASGPGAFPKVVVSTIAGASEAALHHHHNVYLRTRVEIRGRHGFALRYDDQPHVTWLWWMEEPDVGIALLVNSAEDDPFAEALRIAEALERVDDAGWQEFAALTR